MNKKNDIKNIATVLIVLVIIILVFFAGTAYTPNDRVSYSDDNVAPSYTGETDSASDTLDLLAIRDTDVPKGNGPFLLIEYSDYECPFCKRFHPVVQELVDNGEVTWVYRHLPLPFHETAEEGAVIAECVRIHKGGGAFWTYTDSVFEQNTLSLEVYKSLAATSGLSSAQVEKCLESGSEARDVLAVHYKDTQLVGINGTPGSFLVNKKTGKFERVPGALPLESDGSGGPSMRELLNSLR